MLTFVVHRGIGFLVSTFLVITITFVLMQMIPGDPAAVMLGAQFWIAQHGGLYMAWTIGANDVANAMGTSVGSGVGVGSSSTSSPGSGVAVGVGSPR